MTTEKTAVAIRVLTAIHNREEPAERDVLLLRAYCPEVRDRNAGELACIVIQEVLKREKEERDRFKGGQQIA